MNTCIYNHFKSEGSIPHFSTSLEHLQKSKDALSPLARILMQFSSNDLLGEDGPFCNLWSTWGTYRDFMYFIDFLVK